MKQYCKPHSAISLAMCLCLLLVGCGNSSSVDTDSQTSSSQNSSDSLAETELTPSLPSDLDFEEASFTILYPGTAISMKYSFGEQTGDIMSDTLYKRNLSVEEALNVKITAIAHDSLAVNLPIEKSVLSDDGGYQMVLTHSMQGVSSMVTGGLLSDWNDIDYADFDKPWWNSSQIEELAINGKSFYASGSLLVPNPVVLFFNKNMVEQNQLESPYELVKNGNWTLDKVISLAVEVSSDVDGNSVYDEKDTYGFVGEVDWKTISFMFAAGQRITGRTDDGQIELVMNTERMQTILEKVDSLYNGGTYSFSVRVNGSPFSTMFQNGQALLYAESMVNAESYRTTNVNFGIVPLPKLDADQKEYYSLSWTGFMGIPKNTDLELAGAVSELLNYYSYRDVTPVYYDTLLDSKVARDDESAEMLDIIFNDYVSDMGMSYQLSGDLLYALPNLLERGSTNFASYYASYETTALQALKNLLEAAE